MASIESIIARVSELSVDERLDIAMQLLELIRESVGGGAAGGKVKKGKAKAKKSKKDDTSDSETEKKTRAPTTWTTGLAAVRPILEKNSVNKKLAMKIGSLLKELPSWPSPSEKEVMDAAKELETE